MLRVVLAFTGTILVAVLPVLVLTLAAHGVDLDPVAIVRRHGELLVLVTAALVALSVLASLVASALRSGARAVRA